MIHAPVWNTYDALAMSGRSLRAATRQLDALLITVLLPVFLMLLFVYVFGSAMRVGTDYADYVVPGVIILCAGYGASSTAVAVASDLQNGVIDRFKSMPIVGSSVLVGHVVASVVANVLSTSIVIGVAMLTGFRPTADFAAWLGVAGFLILFIVALSWVSTMIGLLVKSIEAASGMTFFVLFLPYLSSAFVPTDTMPKPLELVSRYQPFTPMIETLRSLLLDTPMGNNGWIAAAWFGGMLVLAFAASTWLFDRVGR
ncbi:MAG TPA: ABC transporter permease [Thermomicrobiales bacterium]|nr:ABC transporter permease [Thermomicrobiales bacterium]